MNSILAPNQPGAAASDKSHSQTTTVPSGFVVDWARREIHHHGGRRHKLSARETALLACLARKAGVPVSRDEILSQVWQLDPRCTVTRSIDMHVSLLRRKLEKDAPGPSILITVYRVGYMLHRGAISSADVPPAAVAAPRIPWELLTGIES